MEPIHCDLGFIPDAKLTLYEYEVIASQADTIPLPSFGFCAERARNSHFCRFLMPAFEATYSEKRHHPNLMRVIYPVM